MVTEEVDQKFAIQLKKEGYAEKLIYGSQVQSRYFRETGKLLLRSKVYFNKGFIPKSVRKCLSSELQVSDNHINTSFIVEEDSGTIFIQYLGVTPVEKDSLTPLFEEFGRLACDWRYILEKSEGDDLVYIHKNK